MELKDLVGVHVLSGIDLGTTKENDQCARFALDGIVYEAIEDPSDGYRSYCDEIDISDEPCRYVFPGIHVLCKMSEDKYEDVLEMYDDITNEVILRIGTENIDDWYPCCVMDYRPENMSCNIGR